MEELVSLVDEESEEVEDRWAWVDRGEAEAGAGWLDWIGGEMKLVGGRIPRGIWWNGGGCWEDGTSLLKFRVGLYIYSMWVFG